MSKFFASFSWSMSIILLVFVILTLEELVDGRTILSAANKAIIKTIKVDEYEIIDCYDIYQQPSLNHPLLYNHTIQMRPSMNPKNIKLDNFGMFQLTQTWHKYGTCPRGTVPIRRNIKHYNSTLSRKHRRPKFSHSETPNTLQPNDVTENHEYAVIRVHGNFLGGQAKINLWNPVVEAPIEISVSQIWVVAGQSDDFNSIEAEWEVCEPRYGDYQTRFFRTNINYCTNLECEGFVHISSDIALGCKFSEVSTFKGDQKDATFRIHKVRNSGNWWVEIQGISVGYYPSSLFTQLSKTTTKIEFGGEIYNDRSKGRHTIAQMGSGHFPSEGGLGISSYFHHVQVIDGSNVAKDPEDVETYVSNPSCYNLEIDKKHTNGYGFFYGGQGYNDNCP
ncbi:hypothetical protein MKW98_016768 [Papaver atlanticum]|uniref:Neprosin PEP catalytic domain-containing protein n=1 Tax=Papaver atlanticum TaxID=357466 RepID=A0AAD4TGJ4_9MAGN|nr:hypothetical protein MKW98_016768 [Papaver atlanticum]